MTGVASTDGARGVNPRTIQGGWLDGNRIRRARAAHRCDYWRGRSNGGRCGTLISPGEFYADGGYNGEGGYGVGRYCLMCAGEDAQRAASRVAS